MEEKIFLAEPTAPAKEEPQASQLILTFQAVGSAEFAMQMANVTPAQILAAAAWLDWYARSQMDQMKAQLQAKGPRLVVPQGVQVRGQMQH